MRWPIRSEREVQDILWLLLRGIFHDLEDEDTLPKFGHSTYRADLGIPSLGLLIGVKFARAAADFKTIEKEVLEDVEPYRRSPERYRESLVFIEILRERPQRSRWGGIADGAAVPLAGTV